MDKVQEIMALVGEYGSMIKCEQFDECDDIYSEIESKLRELLERKPLTDEQISELTDVEMSSPSFIIVKAFVKASERAHGIGA